jgi:ATP-dependent Clp protease ATP-binding subunit ClpA
MNWFKPRQKGTPAPLSGSGRNSMEAPSNFTPHAQQVLALARTEAERFNHGFVGTEHILLGLIKLGQGTAVTVLGRMGVDFEKVRLEVERQVGQGPDLKIANVIPYTPRVKKVLALAAKEAKKLNHTYVGTEHILLGMLGEGDGVAARVLKSLGVDIEKTRREILMELDPNFAHRAQETVTPQSAESPKRRSEFVDISKRYDVYCAEANHVVVYRNVLFKGPKKLQHITVLEFVELEQGDGQTIFVARNSVIKFCEHGATPSSEGVPGQKPAA